MAKKKKRKSLVGIFFKTLCLILAVFGLSTAVAVFSYTKLSGNSISFNTDESVASTNSDAKPTGNTNSFLGSIMGRGIKLNVAVFGVDADGTRTDVIFVVHFDSKAKQLSLLSLPRDTRVELADNVIELYKENDRYYESPCKLNAVHSYGGKNGAEATVMQIEDFLGIGIDHYVEVNFEGFRELVDAIGGVDFYVPQDMYWDMRDNGEPLINLKEGMQHLDGDKAEQLVRFRRYSNGDIDRVKVQQDFLRAAAEKILSSDSILKNLPDYISTYYNYVTTDISMVDAVKYVRYVDDIDMNNIQMETIPGVGQMVGKISYYLHDSEGTSALVDEIFYSVPADPDTKASSSKNKKIEVANGGITSGLAKKTQDYLVGEGYNVPQISTYTGDRTEYTRIVVKQSGVGEDLRKYFGSDAKVLVKPELVATGMDIRIIIGTNDTDIGPQTQDSETESNSRNSSTN